MSVVLEPARSNVHGMVADVMELYHGKLHGLEVAVYTEFARRSDGDESGEPPVKFHGVPAVAAVAVVPYKWRSRCCADAVVTIDRDHWGGLDDDRQRALLDTMLAYLEPAVDADGNPKSDDLGRPKLRLAPPDWLLAGHAAVVDRWGDAAVEAVAFRGAVERFPRLRQLALGFGDGEPFAGATCAAASRNA